MARQGKKHHQRLSICAVLPCCHEGVVVLTRRFLIMRLDSIAHLHSCRWSLWTFSRRPPVLCHLEVTVPCRPVDAPTACRELPSWKDAGASTFLV